MDESHGVWPTKGEGKCVCRMAVRAGLFTAALAFLSHVQIADTSCNKSDLTVGRTRYRNALRLGLAWHAHHAINVLEGCLLKSSTKMHTAMVHPHGATNPNSYCNPDPDVGNVSHVRDLSEAWFYLGAAHGLLKNYTSALNAYYCAHQLVPSASATENIGAVFSAMKKWKAAALYYGKAAAMRPNRHDVVESYAKMLYRAGESLKGRRVFADAISMNPNDPSPQYELGRSNELFGSDTIYAQDVNTNFSQAFKLAWDNLCLQSSKSTFRLAEVDTTNSQTSLKWVDLKHLVKIKTVPQHSKSSLLDGGKQIHVAEFLDEVEICGNDALIYSRSEGIVFVPAFGHQIPLHRNLMSLPPNWHKIQPTVDGAILLVQLFAVGYYHFVLEVLPRLLFALQMAPTARVIVPSSNGKIKSFMQGALQMLGVPDSRLVFYDLEGDHLLAGSCRLRVQRLIQVDWPPAKENGIVPGAAHLPPPAALNFLRAAFGQGNSIGIGQKVIIWIQRAIAPTRRLLNDMKLRKMLEELLPSNAKLHVFSDSPSPTFASTVKLFSAAQVVVGLHGAGLANAVFCPAGAHLVEFALPEEHAQYFHHVAVANDLHYHRVLLQGTALYGKKWILAPEGPTQKIFARIAAAIVDS